MHKTRASVIYGAKTKHDMTYYAVYMGNNDNNNGNFNSYMVVTQQCTDEEEWWVVDGLRNLSDS